MPVAFDEGVFAVGEYAFGLVVNPGRAGVIDEFACRNIQPENVAAVDAVAAENQLFLIGSSISFLLTNFGTPFS
jgi:hypothetical protein